MTEWLLYSSAPPVPCCSCVCVHRMYRQYTRDVYLWHLKVIAVRRGLGAAYVGKSRVVSLCWYPAVWYCLTGSERVFSRSTIPDGALFALLLQTTSARNKGAGLRRTMWRELLPARFRKLSSTVNVSKVMQKISAKSGISKDDSLCQRPCNQCERKKHDACESRRED